MFLYFITIHHAKRDASTEIQSFIHGQTINNMAPVEEMFIKYYAENILNQYCVQSMALDSTCEDEQKEFVSSCQTAR